MSVCQLLKHRGRYFLVAILAIAATGGMYTFAKGHKSVAKKVESRNDVDPKMAYDSEDRTIFLARFIVPARRL